MIALYNGDKKIELEVRDESYSYEAIMAEDSLTLYFDYPENDILSKKKAILKRTVNVNLSIHLFLKPAQLTQCCGKCVILKDALNFPILQNHKNISVY